MGIIREQWGYLKCILFHDKYRKWLFRPTVKGHGVSFFCEKCNWFL